MAYRRLAKKTFALLFSSPSSSSSCLSARRCYASQRCPVASYTSSLPVKPVTFTLSKQFQTHLCESPPTTIQTTNHEMLAYYKAMYRMRRLEIAAASLYSQKAIRGFCHLYDGQEAVCTGMEAAITLDDHIITAYRDHTFMLSRGESPGAVLSELMGKATGCSKGKGGSMHMYSSRHNFYGGNGIVGAQVPLGTGIAFTQKYLNTGRVCFTLYGDGAANQGQIFEAYNMAMLWKLPVVYVCENNQYGMGTSIQRAAAHLDFYKRGEFVPGIKVDGMEIFAVREASRFAAEWARSGKGPIILEMNTYRYKGHSMSDPGTSYRDRSEVDSVRNTRDPLEGLKNRILAADPSAEAELNEIEKDCKKEITDAIQFATESPFPEPKQLFTDVYVEPTPIRTVELTQTYRP